MFGRQKKRKLADLVYREVAEPDEYLLKAYAGPELVGTVSTEIDGPSMHLCDITVAPELRGLGLGSRLLKRTIDHAARCGCSEIWGHVVGKDVEQTPHLLGWYRYHGFAVADVDCKRSYLPSTDARHTVTLMIPQG